MNRSEGTRGAVKLVGTSALVWAAEDEGAVEVEDEEFALRR